MEYFDKEACAAIGYYVYRLIDPRNALTFYVEKGIGNRVFTHVKEATASIDGEAFEWANGRLYNLIILAWE